MSKKRVSSVRSPATVRPTADARSKNRLLPEPPAAAQDIARRAYELYLASGCVDGRDVENWLEAEQELL